MGNPRFVDIFVLRDELVGVHDDLDPAAVRLEAEVEYQYACLNGNGETRRVVHYHPARTLYRFLVQEQGDQLGQPLPFFCVERAGVRIPVEGRAP
jgi:hypothetical protein